VFVALVIHHALRMRYIILYCTACPTLQIFPHYLINGTVFEKKKLLITKCVF